MVAPGSSEEVTDAQSGEAAAVGTALPAADETHAGGKAEAPSEPQLRPGRTLKPVLVPLSSLLGPFEVVIGASEVAIAAPEVAIRAPDLLKSLFSP